MLDSHIGIPRSSSLTVACRATAGRILALIADITIVCNSVKDVHVI